jgi:ABC-type glycerol-3-phosphate transport system substrate-binding protein
MTGGGEEILIWHWMTDRDSAFQELAKQYESTTGQKVIFRLIAPTDAYTQSVSVGAQTGHLPDIYGILADNKTRASYIKAGHVYRLNPLLGEGKGSWKDRFFEGALQTNYFAPGNEFGVLPGYYGIPIDITTIPMIYNKTLFEKAGLDPESPPETWDEFIAAGEALRKIGVTGFVSGWAEIWLIYSMATNLAHNLMGAEKVMDTFRGRVPFTDPQWVQVFEAFSKMQKSGFADPGLVSLLNKNAEQNFTSERSGMSFNGSWVVNIFGKMNPDLDYGVFKTPALSDQHPRTVWGAAGTVFNVNGNSQNKDKAVQFLKWLTEVPQAAFLLQETHNLPAVRGVEKGVPPILAQFNKMMEDAIHPSRFTANEEPRVVGEIGKKIQSILIGEKTPQQVAQELQAFKDKIKKKAK